MWIASLAGWRGAFAATGLIGLGWILLWSIFYRAPAQSPFLAPPERRYIESGHSEEGAGAAAVPWRPLLRRREVWGLIVVRFLLDPVFYFYMFWIPQYLGQTRHASLAEIGRLTWIPFLTLGIANIAGGWVSDALVWRGFTVNAARKSVRRHPGTGVRDEVRVAVGLERLVEDLRLDGLAYYYQGVDDNEYSQIISGVIAGASLLTARGVPVAGEGDLKNCAAMLIMDRLGAGGSFAELHPADFREDFVFIGHDGPGHVAISSEKPALRGLSLYHGKFGRGVSVEFKVKNGPITILGLTVNHAGRFKLVVAEGESVPGSIPATGNTNTRCRFQTDVATFIEWWSEAGPTHHFALGIGSQISRLEKLRKLVDLDWEVVARNPEPKN